MKTFAQNPGPRPRPARPFGSSVWTGPALLTAWIVCFLAAQSIGRGAETPPEPTPFRFGFSSVMLLNVNHNDAKAAVKVWGQIIAKERNVVADPEPSILEGADAIATAMQAQKVDAIGFSLSEYRNVNRQQPISDVFVAVQAGRTNVEYVLLVREGGPIKTLADLRGKNLNCYENHVTSLALVWLDTLLAQQGLPLATGFFSQVKHNIKLSAAVLPVFFRQADACLVHRRGFEILCELNPQVGKQLRTLALSPILVPSVFGLRANYQSECRENVLKGLAELHLSPAGQQVLTVFQFDQINRADPSCLQSGLDLLAAHDRLLHGGSATNTASPGPSGNLSKPVAEGSQ